MEISLATETNNDSVSTYTNPILKDTNSNEYKNIIKKRTQ